MGKHELLDLIDEQDQLIGQTMDKAEVHARELLHRDVHVFISDGHGMLQQQRTNDKELMPGQWDVSIGGHVAHGQTYLDAGRRETSEEAGLHYPAHRFIPIGKLATQVLLPNGKIHRTLGENFVVIDRKLRLDDIAFQQEEVQDVRLYDLEQMATDLTDPETAKRHADQPIALWQLGLRGIQRNLRRV